MKPKGNYTAPEMTGNSFVYDFGAGMQVLVMVWNDGTTRVAVRLSSDDTWSAPIAPVRTEKF